MNDQGRLDGRASVADIIAHMDRVDAAALVAMLCERHAIYMDRGTGETERLRANILARLAAMGPPAAALPFVVEELESGDRPASVAAAARAVHGAGASGAALLPHLLASVSRFSDSDEVVRFEGRVAGTPATVLTELLRAIGSLGKAAAAAGPDLRELASRQAVTFAPAVLREIELAIAAIEGDPSPNPAPCCGRVARPRPQTPAATTIDDIEIEDQDGRVGRVSELFAGRPSFVTFFYTRCMNPAKCSLTITKLARLGRRLNELGWADRVTLAAFTYDPEFDRPARLRGYGEARGVEFGPRCRLLRTTGSFEALRDHFSLGVGYGPATVNQHRLECAILDRDGRIVDGIVRRQWSEEEVLTALEPQVHASAAAPAAG